MTLATTEELLNVTGCEPGTVSPLECSQEVPVLVDQDILNLTEVSFGSCQRGVAIIISVNDLMRVLASPKTIRLIKKFKLLFVL